MNHKHRMQQTSIEAYHNLKHLGEDAQTVLVAFHAYPDSTDREIAEKLGYSDPNKVRPRRNELVKIGLVVCSGKRVCNVSHVKAMTWRTVKQ